VGNFNQRYMMLGGNLVGEMPRRRSLRAKRTGFRGGGWDARGSGCQLESLGMRNSILLGWIFRYFRRRGRERDLQAAGTWPTATAKLLAGSVVPRDELAEGTLAQTSQIEFQYYFALGDDFFGGYLRSVACSDTEGRRWLREVAEGTPVTVRYDPQDPDKTHALAGDNAGALPFRVWEM
jgi:hypothetical protein